MQLGYPRIYWIKDMSSQTQVSALFAGHITVHSRLWLKIFLICCFLLFSRLDLSIFLASSLPPAAHKQVPAVQEEAASEYKVPAKINVLVQPLLRKGKAETSSSLCASPFQGLRTGFSRLALQLGHLGHLHLTRACA